MCIHDFDILKKTTGGGGGEIPCKKGGDARWEISIEPLKGTNLGVGFTPKRYQYET